MGNQVFKITTLGKFRSKRVRAIPMRLVAVAEVHDSHTQFQQRSIREGMLVAYIRQPCRDIGLGSAVLWHQGRDAVVGRMVIIEEESARQDVGGRDVYLNL